MTQRLSLCSFALTLLLCGLAGCESQPKESSEPSTSAPNGSAVPLRLWIVSPVSDPSLVERAWLTGSDHKLEVRVLSAESFLAESANNCDVVLFPSRLLGELIDRKWITRLPSSLAASSSPTEDENIPQVPSAWTRQASYGGEQWAVPLGASIPLTIVSKSFIDEGSNASDWNALIDALHLKPEFAQRQVIDPAKVDRAALVDRYLVLVGGLTNRAPDYGLLFELQTMKPRLSEPEFEKAAEILLALAQQKSDEPGLALQAMVGDTPASWSWANAHSQPAVAIAAPSLLNPTAAKISGGKALRIPAKWIGWNTGSGLNASLSANCRQSSRATELLRWLRLSETRQTLAPLIAGIESAAPVSGSDSAAWQATGVTMELANNATIPSELRLARAEEYRHALSDSLLSILSGEKPIPAALADASKAWQKITEARGRLLQRTDYEQSLGLAND